MSVPSPERNSISAFVVSHNGMPVATHACLDDVKSEMEAWLNLLDERAKQFGLGYTHDHDDQHDDDDLLELIDLRVKKLINGVATGDREKRKQMLSAIAALALAAIAKTERDELREEADDEHVPEKP